MGGVASFPLHVRRALKWRLADTASTTVREEAALDKAEVSPNRVARIFIAWRKSALLVAMPSLIFSAFFGVRSAREEMDSLDDFGFNGLGKFVYVLLAFVPIILLLSAMAALICWKNLKLSARIMGWCFVVTLVTPLLPAFLPTDYLYQSSFRVGDDLVVRTFDAISYVLQLVPLILSVPNGVVSGCLRVLGLLPVNSGFG